MMRRADPVETAATSARHAELVTAQRRRLIAAEQAANVLERATRGVSMLRPLKLSREMREVASAYRAAQRAEHEANARFRNAVDAARSAR